MILELFAAGVIGVLVGVAVYRLAITVSLRAGRVRGRLTTVGSRPERDDRIYDVAGWFMDSLPCGWSQWLILRFGNGLSAKLAAAGMSAIEPGALIGAGILLGIAGFIAGWMIVGSGPAGLIAGAAVAYGAEQWPRHQMNARTAKRRLDFVRLLPDFVDMLAIAVGAGLSLDRGIHLYCERFDNTLAAAFSSAMMEIELGKPRHESFRELAEKNKNEDLTWFITSVLQAEKLGSPLARALKEQAASGRERQSELVKELSAVAPVKMLFPIAGLILPALMIIVIGPAFLQFMQ